MRGKIGFFLGAFAAVTLAAPWAATAQNPGGGVNLDPPGSDRAGKTSRVDGPVPEPTPAPGSRLAADAADSRARAPPAPAGVVPPPIIGSHQIDRYDAIEKERKAVADNPKSLADWIILGEIAHEVAMDAPADVAGKYFKMSGDAFEKALALDPGNSGLKAAVQFAKDQQANVDQFETSRDKFTDTYLAARRRDLASTRNTPYVKMYEPPLPDRTLPGPAPTTNPGNPNPNADNVFTGSPAARNAVAGNVAGTTLNQGGAPPATPAAVANAARRTTDPAVDSAVPLVRPAGAPVAEAAPAVTPAQNNAPATNAANYGTQQNYSANTTAPMLRTGPRYRPFATANGVPYTYQEYANSYFPAGLYDNPAVPPVTTQGYAPASVVAPVAPGAAVVPNAFERQILNNAGATTPAPASPAPR